jgi:hypothetical protein
MQTTPDKLKLKENEGFSVCYFTSLTGALEHFVHVFEKSGVTFEASVQSVMVADFMMFALLLRRTSPTAKQLLTEAGNA